MLVSARIRRPFSHKAAGIQDSSLSFCGHTFRSAPGPCWIRQKRRQYPKVGWFREVCVESTGKGLSTVVLLAPPSQRNNARLVGHCGTHPAARLVSVQTRQADVQENYVGQKALGKTNSLFAVMRDGGRSAVRLNERGEGLRRIYVVVNYQHPP